MIFKQETQILKCTFEKEHFSKVKAAFYGGYYYYTNFGNKNVPPF